MSPPAIKSTSDHTGSPLHARSDPNTNICYHLLDFDAFALAPPISPLASGRIVRYPKCNQ